VTRSDSSSPAQSPSLSNKSRLLRLRVPWMPFVLASAAAVIDCLRAQSLRTRTNAYFKSALGMAPRIQDYFRLLLQRRRVKRSFKNSPHASVLKSKLYKFAARA
jgi:hypothetical protein